MFKDYYAILDINEHTSLEQIKEAFKKQAIKWHPDKNVDFDTTEIMQDINEAFLILKDFEARVKYDAEYRNFKVYREESTRNNSQSSKNSRGKGFEKNYYREYVIKDSELHNWMKNASHQAIDLAKETIRDIAGMMKQGCLASSGMFLASIISIVIATLLWFVLFSASKSCN